MTTAARKEAVVELLAKDLNANGGVFCPSAKADMKLWNNHPRVYLDVAGSGSAMTASPIHCGATTRERVPVILSEAEDLAAAGSLRWRSG